MDNFIIKFNFDFHIWELIDNTDKTVLDQSDSLDEMLVAYPSIEVTLPSGMANEVLGNV